MSFSDSPNNPGFGAGPTILVPPASGDITGARDGAAITAALAALGGPGTLQFRGGQYYDNTQRNLASLQILQGTGGVSAGATPGTRINYTGVAASYINAQGLTGTQLRDIMVFANNAGFTGRLVDLSANSSLPRIERCYLGAVDITASVLLYMDNSQDAVIQSNNINGGRIGIQGVATAAHFANGHHIVGNRFAQAGSCLSGMGTGWFVAGNVFELTGGEPAVAAGPSAAGGCALMGNWTGDATAGTVVFQIFGNGISLRGNYIGGNAGTAIRFTGTSDGIEIAGNRFDSHTLGIDKNAQAVTNIDIGPNSYTNVVTHHNFVAGGAAYIEA